MKISALLPVLALAIGASLSPAQASADAVYATYVYDTVSDVYVGADGILGVDPENDGANTSYKLCSISSPLNSIPTAVCAGWLQIALAAQLSHHRVRIDFGKSAPTYAGIVSYFKVYKN